MFPNAFFPTRMFAPRFFPKVGATPSAVGSDNAPTGMDLPELGGVSPGSILLGQPGGLT